MNQKSTPIIVYSQVLAITIFLFILTSCSSDEPVINNNISTTAHFNMPNTVTLSDIKTLFGQKDGTTRSNEDINYVIDVITNVENDTLAYVVNFSEGGWVMCSSDSRIPPVIAHSSTGCFSNIMLNDACKEWINDIVNDIDVIRNLPDEKLNFSENQIADNKVFWFSLDNSDECVKQSIQIQNTNIGPIIPDTDWTKYGHYELLSSYISYEIQDFVPRLTTTDWHQDSPYNNYCPYNSRFTKRAPAGCVAIAAAQMLYFLHEKFGVPQTAPSKAYCYGNVNASDGDYNWAQYDYNSTVWQEMKHDGAAAAPLIADIGRRVGMAYSDYGSGAKMDTLPESVFDPYGIDCSFSYFNSSIVESNLKNGVPVILGAHKDLINGMFVGGHTFITDKFKKSRTVRVDRYKWVYDRFPQNSDGPLIPIPDVPEKVESTYLTDFLPYIGMNWGWGNLNGENDAWYAPTDSWYVGDSATAYKYNKVMVHSFSIKN